jgi:DNA repair protein RadC
MSAARLSRQLRAALESEDANAIVAAALFVLEKRAKYERCTLTSPSAARDWLRLRLARSERGEFACIFPTRSTA